MEPLQGERTCIRGFVYNHRLKAVESIRKTTITKSANQGQIGKAAFPVGSMAFNIGYQKNILNPCCKLFHPAKVFLKVFSILSPLGVL